MSDNSVYDYRSACVDVHDYRILAHVYLELIKSVDGYIELEKQVFGAGAGHSDRNIASFAFLSRV